MNSEWDFIIMSFIPDRHFRESFLGAKNVRILICTQSLQKLQWGRLSYYHHFIDVTLKFSNFAQVHTAEKWRRQKLGLDSLMTEPRLLTPHIVYGWMGFTVLGENPSSGDHSWWEQTGHFILVSSMVSTFPFLGQKSLVEIPSVMCLSPQYFAWSWVSHHYYLTIWSWRSAVCASLRVGGRFVCVCFNQKMENS